MKMYSIGDYVYFMANDKVRHGKIYDYFGSEYFIEVKIKCDEGYAIRTHNIEFGLCFNTINSLFNYLKTTQKMLLEE